MVRIGVTGAMVTGLATLLVLSIAVYLIRRRYAAEDQGGESGDSVDQRRDIADQYDDRGAYSLSVRQRFAGLTTPSKLLVGGIFVVMAVIIFETWTFFRTGSPSQIFFAREVQLMVVGAIGAVGGVLFERRRRGKQAKVISIHEADPEGKRGEPRQSSQAEIQYSHVNEVEGDDGALVATEYQKSLFMGLFRNPKRVADDRRLRNDDAVNRPPDDKVRAEIPEHAVEVEPDVYVFRTMGKETVKDPTDEADYYYKPPFSMPREQAARFRSDLSMMTTEVEETRAQLAQRDEKIRELRRTLENTETEVLEELVSLLERFAPLLSDGDGAEMVLSQIPEERLKMRNGDGNGTTEQLADLQDGVTADGAGGAR